MPMARSTGPSERGAEPSRALTPSPSYRTASSYSPTKAHPPGEPSDSDAEVTRLLPNGRPDTSFGHGGTVFIDFGGRLDAANCVAVAANGDILVGGELTTVRSRGSDAVPAFARLH